MVGTNPRRLPPLREARHAARISAIVLQIFISGEDQKGEIQRIAVAAARSRLPLASRVDSWSRQTHRTTMGTSVFAAQTSAITQPITVHPRKILSSTMAAVSRLLRASATIEGRKYITKPKPLKCRKNAGKR